MCGVDSEIKQARSALLEDHRPPQETALGRQTLFGEMCFTRVMSPGRGLGNLAAVSRKPRRESSDVGRAQESPDLGSSPSFPVYQGKKLKLSKVKGQMQEEVHLQSPALIHEDICVPFGCS